MALKEMQERVDAWVSQYSKGYWNAFAILARLVEEVGELSRELNHSFGPKTKKDSEPDNEIAMEIGDILFTLACLANSLDIDMDAAFDRTMRKYEQRDSERWDK